MLGEFEYIKKYIKKMWLMNLNMKSSNSRDIYEQFIKKRKCEDCWPPTTTSKKLTL